MYVFRTGVLKEKRVALVLIIREAVEFFNTVNHCLVDTGWINRLYMCVMCIYVLVCVCVCVHIYDK